MNKHFAGSTVLLTLLLIGCLLQACGKHDREAPSDPASAGKESSASAREEEKGSSTSAKVEKSVRYSSDNNYAFVTCPRISVLSPGYE